MTKPRGREIPGAVLERLRAKVEELGGKRTTARRLGIGRETLERCLAGRTVNAGTLALLEGRLASAVGSPRDGQADQGSAAGAAEASR
jgi:hypothetical protein